MLPLSPRRLPWTGEQASHLPFFRADGQILASGGREGTVKIWETNSGVCLRTLRPDRRYERVDITGLTGINEAQRQALLDEDKKAAVK